jgi:ketosteroid isomerase-like protein
MSQENVEIVRRAVEQWLRDGGTLDAIPVEAYADDVEWDLSGYLPVDGPTRGAGRLNLLATLGYWFSAWTRYRAEAREFIDAGEDVVVVVLHETAGIGDSDVFVERDLFQVFTLRNGLVVKWRFFETRAQALEAVGLRE